MVGVVEEEGVEDFSLLQVEEVESPRFHSEIPLLHPSQRDFAFENDFPWTQNVRILQGHFSAKLDELSRHYLHSQFRRFFAHTTFEEGSWLIFF